MRYRLRHNFCSSQVCRGAGFPQRWTRAVPSQADRDGIGHTKCISSGDRPRRSAFVLVCTFKQRNRHEEPRNGVTSCRPDGDIPGLRAKRFRRLQDRFRHQLLWDGRSARRRSLEPEHIVRQQWWRIKRAIEICPCAAQRLWRQHFTGECGPRCRLSGPAPKTRIEAYSRVKGSRRGREIQSASTPFA
jgi:hypothetical protein